MIGNAHIDPVWMWTLAEGRQEVLDTYRSALDHIRETEQFVFTSGGAATYRWVQQDDPEMFAEIQQRVAQGRWSLVNGWWVQPDCNIPCGESFVRHGLYGQRALQEMFGRRAETGYNVDSFGHAGSLPQILDGCGLHNYVFFRPQPGKEKELPGTIFWWKSDDGTRVLTSRPPLHYPSHPGGLVERIDAAAALAPTDVGHVMCFYGVGNHGGGPTRANIESILTAMRRPDGPDVRFGSTDQFFALIRAANASLPILWDELQHHSRGCYTAVSKCKWYNRKCEHALLTAEKFAALAHRYCELPYPIQALSKAWQNVLFNQFHDILAGTSLREAYDEAYESYEESESIADTALETALAALAEHADTQGPGRPLVVFNPHPWTLVVPIETSVPVTANWHGDWQGALRPGEMHLVDHLGERVPCQVTALEHSGGQYLIHICFTAELPALGYRCYHLTVPRDAPTWRVLERTPIDKLENELLCLTFDPQTGWLTSLHDKVNDIEFLEQPGGVPLVIDDPSDTWSHDVVSFDQVIGRFVAREGAVLIDQGPVRQTVRVCSHWGNSTAILDYTLYEGDKKVYLEMTVDWHEQLKMLKLGFPLSLTDPQSTASIPYGKIQRIDDGGEEPCQSWVDLSGLINGRACGLALLNDCKYGYDVCGSELRMSILRSPIYAFHHPRQIEHGVTYHYTDQGEQTIRMVLVLHTGSWREQNLMRRAEALNAPPIAAEVTSHRGDWPATMSLLECTADNVVLTVLKRSEKGDSLILRGYETTGQETACEIVFGPVGKRTCWDVRWKPYEIKTWCLGPSGPPVETNLLEEPL
jgi:alpha-mannosidase